MARALWPDMGSPADDALLARGTWGALFDRWTYTSTCFVRRLLYDDPMRERFVAHRLVLMAAAGYGAPDYPGFERALCDEVLVFLADHIGPLMSWRAEHRPELRPMTTELLRLSKRDQLLLLLYDFDDGSGRTSNHEDGRFRAGDVARLWNKPDGTVRVQALRARERLRLGLVGVDEASA